MSLIPITFPDFDVDLDIAYATDNNVSGRVLYKQAACYLHVEAANCLRKAIGLAALQGLRFRIFDAYRPIEVQQALWDDNPNPNFLSDPNTGAVPHCRGVAVDLTLVDSEGKALDMGTGFDDFSTSSYHGAKDINVQAQRNRYILLGIMMTAGWDFYRNEWWHYQLFNPREFPVFTDKEAGTNMVF